jgi:hypothetical protein
VGQVEAGGLEMECADEWNRRSWDGCVCETLRGAVMGEAILTLQFKCETDLTEQQLARRAENRKDWTQSAFLTVSVPRFVQTWLTDVGSDVRK